MSCGFYFYAETDTNAQNNPGPESPDVMVVEEKSTSVNDKDAKKNGDENASDDDSDDDVQVFFHSFASFLF